MNSPIQGTAPLLMSNVKVASSMPQRQVFIPDAANEDAISADNRNEYNTWVTKILIPSLEKNEVTFLTSRDKLFPMKGHQLQLTIEAIENCSLLLYPLLPALAGKFTEKVLNQYWQNKAIFLEVREDCLQQFQHITQFGYSTIKCTNENEVDEMVQRLKTQLPSSVTPIPVPMNEREQLQKLHFFMQLDHVSTSTCDQGKTNQCLQPLTHQSSVDVRPKSLSESDKNVRSAIGGPQNGGPSGYLTVEPDISLEKPSQNRHLPDLLVAPQESHRRQCTLSEDKRKVKDSIQQSDEYAYVYSGRSIFQSKPRPKCPLPPSAAQTQVHIQHTLFENNNSTYLCMSPRPYQKKVEQAQGESNVHSQSIGTQMVHSPTAPSRPPPPVPLQIIETEEDGIYEQPISWNAQQTKDSYHHA